MILLTSIRFLYPFFLAKINCEKFCKFSTRGGRITTTRPCERRWAWGRFGFLISFRMRSHESSNDSGNSSRGSRTLGGRQCRSVPTDRIPFGTHSTCLKKNHHEHSSNLLTSHQLFLRASRRQAPLWKEVRDVAFSPFLIDTDCRTVSTVQVQFSGLKYIRPTIKSPSQQQKLDAILYAIIQVLDNKNSCHIPICCDEELKSTPGCI